MSPLSIRRHRPDYFLILAMVALLLLGLVVIYSVSPILSHKLLDEVGSNYFLYNQLIHIAIGLVAFTAAAIMPYERWQKLLPGLVIACGISLLLMMIPGLGITTNGATRWLGIGTFSFQPAELIKLTLVIYFAQWFANATREELRTSKNPLWLTLAVLGVVAIFVLFLQKDMGTMLVMIAIITGLFYSSGVSRQQLGMLLGITGALGVSSIILFPHRMQRVMTFLNPSENIADSGYHLNQALIAIGSGGLFGLGLGKSVQIYGYLPEAANDSIFAIIAETFGLFGSLLIMAIFALLFYRGFIIALRAPDRFSQFLALGIVLWLGSQTVINIAAMIGIIPLTGIPMPFLSYGGTSLVFTMTALGILVNISKQQQRGAYADRALRRRNGWSYNTSSSGRTLPQTTR